MVRLASMMATAALLLSADASGLLRTPPPSQVANISPDENFPVLQGTAQSADK